MSAPKINVPRLLKWLDERSAMATRAGSHTYAARMAEAAALIRLSRTPAPKREDE